MQYVPEAVKVVLPSLNPPRPGSSTVCIFLIQSSYCYNTIIRQYRYVWLRLIQFLCWYFVIIQEQKKNLPAPLPKTITSPPSQSSALPDVLACMLKDTTSEHKTHIFDLKCKICTGELIRHITNDLQYHNVVVLLCNDQFYSLSKVKYIRRLQRNPRFLKDKINLNLLREQQREQEMTPLYGHPLTRLTLIPRRHPLQIPHPALLLTVHL